MVITNKTPWADCLHPFWCHRIDTVKLICHFAIKPHYWPTEVGDFYSCDWNYYFMEWSPVLDQIFLHVAFLLRFLLRQVWAFLSQCSEVIYKWTALQIHQERHGSMTSSSCHQWEQRMLSISWNDNASVRLEIFCICKIKWLRDQTN